MELLYDVLGVFCFGTFIWLCIALSFHFLDGWYSLAGLYPDQSNELSLLTLTGLSQAMPVGNRGPFYISICVSGLRVGITKLFDPFSRDFFVPWSEVKVVRKKYLWFGDYVELSFGGKKRLVVESYIANRIWRLVPESWPEKGQLPPPMKRCELLLDISKIWLMLTALMSAFFWLGPRVLDTKEPPILFFIVVAVMISLSFLFEYRRRLKINGDT